MTPLGEGGNPIEMLDNPERRHFTSGDLLR
jgi:hypothetical protein